MVRVLGHYVSSRALLAVAFEAALIFLVTTLSMRAHTAGSVVVTAYALPIAMSFSAALILAIGALGLYDGEHSCNLASAFARLVIAFGIVVPAASWVLCGATGSGACGNALQVSAVPALLGILAFRAVMSSSGAPPKRTRRMLIVGTGPEAVAIVDALRSAGATETQVVGFYPTPTETPRSVPYALIINPLPSLAHAALALKADEIVVAVREKRGGMPQEALLECRLKGITVTDLLSFFERTRAQLLIDVMPPSWLIYGDGFRQGLARRALKRSFDLIASLVLLVITLPIMLLTALAILAEDGFPVLYFQERVGLNGKVFNVIKFRSMRRDAEKHGAVWAQARDPRITRVGAIIRTLRIDELPQLLNVFLGDMSIVGPRPERPVFVDQLAEQIPYFGARHSVKPGVTGWAQIKYKYGTSVEDARQKLQYDLYYVKNHSLFLDALILWRTVWVVLAGKGAH